VREAGSTGTRALGALPADIEAIEAIIAELGETIAVTAQREAALLQAHSKRGRTLSFKRRWKQVARRSPCWRKPRQVWVGQRQPAVLRPPGCDADGVVAPSRSHARRSLMMTPL